MVCTRKTSERELLLTKPGVSKLEVLSFICNKYEEKLKCVFLVMLSGGTDWKYQITKKGLRKVPDY